jgi:hypothetical protein
MDDSAVREASSPPSTLPHPAMRVIAVIASVIILSFFISMNILHVKT